MKGTGDVPMVRDSLTDIPGVQNAFHTLIQANCDTQIIESVFSDSFIVHAKKKIKIVHIAVNIPHNH
jgi:hypothetical protein